MATVRQFADAEPDSAGRDLPHNIEAEAALLGALMLDNRMIDSLPVPIEAGHFFEPLHGRIYGAIRRLVATGTEANPVTLRPLFEGDDAMKKGLSGPGYLAKLTGSGAVLIGVRDFAKQIYDLAMWRELVSAGRDFVEAAMDASQSFEPLEKIGQAEAALSKAMQGLRGPSGLEIIDASELDGKPIPPREWAWHEYAPLGSATLLTGKGSAGKSLFAQQLMTCIALGRPCLGVPTRQGRALYITAEDDDDELHRRQAAINAALGCTWADLKGRLFLRSLRSQPGGEQDVALCAPASDHSGRIVATDRWRSIVATLEQHGIAHLALDHVGHFFAGDENVRNQVATFTRLIDGLAGMIGGSVIFIGHTSKGTGRAAGSEYSGSTAWENHVRSRLFLEIPDGDADARTLTRSKSNYAQRGGDLRFMWHRWAFILPDDVPPDTAAAIAATARDTAENDRFMACLAARTEQKRPVSQSPQARENYAPRAFAAMAEARGMNEAAFKRAMERLFTLRTIETGELPFDKPGSRGHRAVGLRPSCAPAHPSTPQS